MNYIIAKGHELLRWVQIQIDNELFYQITAFVIAP